MKAKINGMVVEGTVQEIIELKKAMKEEETETVTFTPTDKKSDNKTTAWEKEWSDEELPQKGYRKTYQNAFKKPKPKVRSPRKWTPKNVKIVKDNYHRPVNEIKELLGDGFTYDSVRTRLYELAKSGVIPYDEVYNRKWDKDNENRMAKHSSKKLSDADKEMCRVLKEKGGKVKETARELGRSYYSVKNRLYNLINSGTLSRDEWLPTNIKGRKRKMPVIKNGRYISDEDEIMLSKLKELGSLAKTARQMGVTYNTLYSRLTKLKERNLIDKDEYDIQKGWKKVLTPKEEEVRRKSSKRFKWVHSRIKDLTRKYGWSYEKAMKVASDEYAGRGSVLGSVKTADGKKYGTSRQKQARSQQEQTVVEKFPYFNSISSLHQHFVEDMLRNMIANKGTLTFREMFSVMNRTNSTTWNGTLWLEFLTEVLSYSKRLADYFGVPNEFRIKKDSKGYDILAYGY